MTMSYARHAVLLRSLRHQLSCLSIRGVHQHIRETPTCLESPFLYRTSTKEAINKPLGCSLQKTFYSQTVDKYRWLSGLNINNIDDGIKPNLKYDCPKVSDLQIEISTPSVISTEFPLDEPRTNPIEIDTPGTSSMVILKSINILKIREQKMKKHKRRRRMDRIWPVMKRRKLVSRKKKEKYLQKKLLKMRMYGEDYDALEDIKAKLEQAKSKGYQFNIFGDQTQNFGFTDGLKQKK